MRLTDKIRKVRNKGVTGSLSLLWQMTVFSHWKMYLLERPLELQTVQAHKVLQPVQVKPDDLRLFEKNFSSYIPSIRRFLREGSRPQVYVDENGDAYLMLWVHEGSDYRDRYYNCTVPVPQDCIYQFAGELARERPASSYLFYALQQLWDESRTRGFRRVRALVNENNRRAMVLHGKLGFVETGRVVHVYRLFRVFSFSRHEHYQGNRLELHAPVLLQKG